MIKRGWLESGWDGRQHRRLSPRFSLGTLFLGAVFFALFVAALMALRRESFALIALRQMESRPIAAAAQADLQTSLAPTGPILTTRLDTGTRVDRGVTRQTPDMPFEKASQPDSAHQLRPLSLVLPNSLSGQALILEECAHRVWAFNNTQQAMERMRTALIGLRVASGLPAQIAGSTAISTPLPASLTWCARHVARIQARSPSWGLPPLVDAGLSVAQADPHRAETLLLRSQKLSPSEGWLAQNRVLLARHLPDTPSLLTAVEGDLALLLSTPSLSQWVAELYLRENSSRDRIRNVAERLPQQTQNHFLSELRRSSLTRSLQ